MPLSRRYTNQDLYELVGMLVNDYTLNPPTQGSKMPRRLRLLLDAISITWLNLENQGTKS
jgi:hypothetical protein